MFAHRDRDPGNARLIQHIAHRDRFGQRGRQHDTAHIDADEQARRLCLFRVAFAFARFQQQMTACASSAGQGTDQELAEIGGGRVGMEQADLRRFADRQRAGRRIRPIAELLDRIEHDLARFFTHIGTTIDDPRHGHRRYAGFARHVLYGRTALTAPG